MKNRILTQLKEQFAHDYASYRKALALWLILTLGFVITGVYIVFLALWGKKLFAPNVLSIFLISAGLIELTIALTYLLLRSGRLNLASQFLVFASVANLLVVSYIRLIGGYGLMTIYNDTFYFLAIFVIMGSLYLSSTWALVNFLLILVNVWILFLLGYPHINPEERMALTRSLVSYSILLTTGFFVVRFTAGSLEQVVFMLNTQKAKNEQQLKQLNRLMHYIRDAAEHLAQASEKLDALSSEVAETSQVQATSAEEIAASTEQMTSTVDNNKHLSEQTYQSAINAVKTLRDSTEKLSQTIENFILISKKLRIISQIAEKTDILAINAAIEAAHAGKYGKGFAVVASEIRKLSDNAKTAAKEITVLVDQIKQVAFSTQESFNNVAEKILQTTTMIEHINFSSDEILSAINQINNALNQLTGVAEKNSSAVQKMANNAKQLVQMSGKLMEVLGSVSK